MPSNPQAFRDRARHLTYAYEQTERHYGEYPPNDDIVPIAAAINAWTLICGCYMGIEQTMKLLILMQLRITKVPRHLKIHDLSRLYPLLDDSKRLVVSRYYGIYRSLHDFDSGGIALDTAEQFIRYVGDGYTSWRYILIDGPAGIPKVHIGLMIETWRALVDIVNSHVSGTHYESIEGRLSNYIAQRVVVAAGEDSAWQRASQDESESIQFKDIHDWFNRNGGHLQAGMRLFDRSKRDSLFSPEDPPLLRDVLFRAADNAVRSPETCAVRRIDLNVFLDRINHGGLVWNSDRGVFE